MNCISSSKTSPLNAMIPLLDVFWAVMFYRILKFLLSMTLTAFPLLGIFPNFWLIIEAFHCFPHTIIDLFSFKVPLWWFHRIWWVRKSRCVCSLLPPLTSENWEFVSVHPSLWVWVNLMNLSYWAVGPSDPINTM